MYLGKYTVRPMDGFWGYPDPPFCLRSWGPSCDVPIHLRGRMCVDMTHWYILIPFFQDVVQHSCLLSACCICFMTFPSPTEFLLLSMDLSNCKSQLRIQPLHGISGFVISVKLPKCSLNPRKNKTKEPHGLKNLVWSTNISASYLDEPWWFYNSSM